MNVAPGAGSDRANPPSAYSTRSARSTNDVSRLDAGRSCDEGKKKSREHGCHDQQRNIHATDLLGKKRKRQSLGGHAQQHVTDHTTSARRCETPSSCATEAGAQNGVKHTRRFKTPQSAFPARYFVGKASPDYDNSSKGTGVNGHTSEEGTLAPEQFPKCKTLLITVLVFSYKLVVPVSISFWNGNSSESRLDEVSPHLNTDEALRFTRI